MALQETDLLVVGRGAATYKVELKKLSEFILPVQVDGGFANSTYGGVPPAIDGGTAS